jgi:uncharacterized protein YndB with AHSA1/START domain
MILTVETTLHAPIEKVWNCWTLPEHIMKWNHASDDWHTTAATNDLRVGGHFSSTMAAKDGSFSFDFGGMHTKVEAFHTIETTLGDGRKMAVYFSRHENQTLVTEHFEPESENSHELQLGGWQAILDNFKKYVESNE